MIPELTIMVQTAVSRTARKMELLVNFLEVLVSMGPGYFAILMEISIDICE